MADKRIVINYDLWKKGVSGSGIVGLESAELVNMEIPGILRPSRSSSKTSEDSPSGDEITATPLRILYDGPNDDLYAMDNNTKPHIYRSTDAGDTWALMSAYSSGTNSAGKGGIIWKGYFFSFAGVAIDVYGPLDTFSLVDADWTVGGQPIATGTSDSLHHPAIVSEDDALYIGHKNIITKIEENAGQTFDPTSSATFTVTATALDLPSNVRIRTLNELNGRLMIGTWVNASVKHAKIYPWDRISSSFDRPIEVQESGVRAAMVVGNLMYFVAGDKGNLYVTDGTSVQLLKKLPPEIGSLDGTGVTDVYPYAITYDKGKLWIGYFGDYIGIWSYDPLTGALVKEHTISAGTNSTAIISAIYPSYGGTGLQYGWFYSSSYGVDKVGTNFNSAHISYIESPVYQVGTKNNPYTFNLMEVNLAKNISSNGVRVDYRTVHTGPYTTIDTFSTDGVSSFKKEIGNLRNIEKIQFKISFTGSPPPELMSVIIY